jgi:hypothetical protein
MQRMFQQASTADWRSINPVTARYATFFECPKLTTPYTLLARFAVRNPGVLV